MTKTGKYSVELINDGEYRKSLAQFYSPSYPDWHDAVFWSNERIKSMEAGNSVQQTLSVLRSQA